MLTVQLLSREGRLMPINPALTQFSTDTPGILVSNSPTTEVISCARYSEGMGFSVSGYQN